MSLAVLNTILSTTVGQSAVSLISTSVIGGVSRIAPRLQASSIHSTSYTSATNIFGALACESSFPSGKPITSAHQEEKRNQAFQSLTKTCSDRGITSSMCFRTSSRGHHTNDKLNVNMSLGKAYENDDVQFQSNYDLVLEKERHTNTIRTRIPPTLPRNLTSDLFRQEKFLFDIEPERNTVEQKGFIISPFA